MSDPSNLIPKLHEIMEEYAKLEEEIFQETQSRAVHEEERPEARMETEQSTKETRKRKKGAEEAGAEQREEKVSNFVSGFAYFA